MIVVSFGTFVAPYITRRGFGLNPLTLEHLQFFFCKREKNRFCTFSAKLCPQKISAPKPETRSLYAYVRSQRKLTASENVLADSVANLLLRCHIETITGDITALRDKLRRISGQISGTDNAFRQQMEGFIEVSYNL